MMVLQPTLLTRKVRPQIVSESRGVLGPNLVLRSPQTIVSLSFDCVAVHESTLA